MDMTDVAKFWTQNGTNPKYIWEMVQPQWKPADTETVETVAEVQRLITSLIDSTKAGLELSHFIEEKAISFRSDCCRTNHLRTLPLTGEEAIFTTYLAALSLDNRKAIVFDETAATALASEGMSSESLERAHHQLLAEAELVQYAIETSDEATALVAENVVLSRS
jgi:hypothetical protein